jgi:hypothetical protein
VCLRQKLKAMKRNGILFILSILIMSSLSAQTVRSLPPAAFELYPALQDMYGYAIGQHEDYLLVFGGNIRSDVPEQYVEDFPNQEILLLDMASRRAVAFAVGNLEGLLAEQAGATGMAFSQVGNTLYLLGGYGYSESKGEFVTFPYLTAIELDAAVEALLAGQTPKAFFYQLSDERLAIFDGIMDYNGDEFFLVGGRFAFKLRPFSSQPDYFEDGRHGEAHSFRLEGKGRSLRLAEFTTWYSLEDFRDYYGPLLPEAIEDELRRLLPKQAQ